MSIKLGSRRGTIQIACLKGSHRDVEHLADDEDHVEMEDDEEFDNFSDRYPASYSEVKLEESKISEEEEKDRGEKALSYVQGMLKRGSISGVQRGSRRIVDWEAMPKEEEDEESKQEAAKIVEIGLKWYDKVKDVTACCPKLVSYLENELEAREAAYFAHFACQAGER